MSNNLSVKITADVTELQTKFAVARAETQALNSEFNNLARQSAAGSLDAAGQARFQQLSGDLLAARTQAAGLAKEMREAGVSVAGFGVSAVRAAEGASQLGHHNATAVRYARELFDEISSGRTRYLPSTLAALAQQTLGMSGAMLAAVGAVAAVTAGLGYLAYHALEAKAAIQNLNIEAERTGNFGISTAAVKKFMDTATDAANVSQSDAQKIGAALVSIPNMAEPTFEALSHMMSDWMLQTGQKSEEVAKEWGKTFSGSAEAAAAAAHLSQAQIDAARAADQTGNAYKVQASQLQTLLAVYERAATETAEKASTLHTGSVLEDAKNLAAYLGGTASAGVGTAAGREDVYNRLLAENTAQMHANVEAVRERITALQAMQSTPEQTLQKGMSLVESINPEIVQVRKLRSEIQELTAAKGVAKTPEQIIAIDQAIQKLQEDINKLRGTPIDLSAALSGLSDEVGNELLKKQQEIANEIPKLMSDAEERAAAQQLAIEERLANEKHAIAEREIQDANKTLNEIAAEQKRSDEERLRSEKRVVSGIESAENTMISGLIRGRMSFAQLARQTAIRLAESEIQSAAHAVTERLILQRSGATAEKAVSAQLGMKTVMQDAGKAAAGAYSAVAAIPYVGPFLAPAAAATAYAGVMAFEGLASLDVGTNYVPQDMIAQIHEGEAVVPKEYNPAAGGTPTGGETHHYTGDTHIRALDTQDMARALKRNRGGLAAGLQRAYRRGAFNNP